jgi:hypothetical protein
LIFHVHIACEKLTRFTFTPPRNFDCARIVLSTGMGGAMVRVKNSATEQDIALEHQLERYAKIQQKYSGVRQQLPGE